MSTNSSLSSRPPPLYGLILGAGLGTRMGSIGKIVPKILWPIFERKIIELEIEYANSLGCQKIFINTHFLHKEVELWFAGQKYTNVQLTYEPELLLSGGPIHNVAQNYLGKYDGHLLVISGDQFYFFDNKIFQKARLELSAFRAILFGLKAASVSGYNRLIISEQKKLTNIEQYHSGLPSQYITYSGTSLINLKTLSPVNGPSSFFQSVADYKNSLVQVETPDNSEYWDFGTLNRYKDSMAALLSALVNYQHSPSNGGDFLAFCIKHHVFDFKKVIGEHAYFCPSDKQQIVIDNTTADFIIEKGISEIFYRTRPT